MGAVFRTTGPLTENETHLYVERPEDRLVAGSIRRGDYVALIGSRQVGKTSLLLRLRRQLLNDGHIPIYLDPSPAKDREQERWYEHLQTVVQEQLDLTVPGLVVPPIEDQIDFRAALKQISQLSSGSSNQIVILLDETSVVPESVAELFFSTIRTIFNERDLIPEFRRYVFVMAGTFNPNELVKEPVVSPFNVAEHIHMGDADRRGIAGLVRNLERLGFVVSDDVIDRIYEWTEGHLYLTQRLCHCLESMDPTELSVQHVDSVIDELVIDRHIRHLYRELDKNPDARKLLHRVLNGDHSVFLNRNNSLIANLELIGVIKPNDKGYCVLRNGIYERALRYHPDLAYDAAAELTEKEYTLFKFMIRNVNRTCSTREIAEAVWGPGSFAETGIENRVQRLVGRLRRKIKRNPTITLRIVTISGRGYKPRRGP